MIFSISLYSALLLLPLLSLRLLYVLQAHRVSGKPRAVGTYMRVLIVLGSGGHTAEMFAMLSDLDTRRYTHRTYLVSSGDDFSVGKAHDFEHALRGRFGQQATVQEQYGVYDIAVVPRARRVHQSMLTAPLTCAQCLWTTLRVLREGKGTPDIVMMNGPATAVIVVLATFVLRLLGLHQGHGKMRTIYVESWARVKALSLSGKLLLPVVDRFLVQWEALRELTGGRAEYRGVLV